MLPATTVVGGDPEIVGTAAAVLLAGGAAGGAAAGAAADGFAAEATALDWSEPHPPMIMLQPIKEMDAKYKNAFDAICFVSFETLLIQASGIKTIRVTIDGIRHLR